MDEEDDDDTGPPPPWERNFIKRMIELRAAKMSQTELARQLQERGLPFHQQTVQRVEKGERPLRLNEAYAIAEILGTDPFEMTRTLTNDEEALQHAVGEVTFYAAHMVQQGLRLKEIWDRERHRLRIAAEKLQLHQASPEDKLQNAVEHALKLSEDAHQVNKLILEGYQELARLVTGQKDSLIKTTTFDPVTRENYAVLAVPWTAATLEESRILIDPTRRRNDRPSGDDDEFS
jgi:Helix-turn-helix